MLITSHPQVAFKSRLIRNHGEGVAQESWSDEELMNVIGMNFRLTELQAAVMIPQLLSLKERNRIRQKNVQYLERRLKNFPQLIFPVIENGADYVCFMLKLKYQPLTEMPERDLLIKALNTEGIPVTKGYGRLMYENPIFTRKMAFGKSGFPWNGRDIRYGKGTCPKSEAINQQFVWFKFINPPNTTEDMEDVVRAFEKVLL